MSVSISNLISQASNFNGGTNLVGYKDRLQWAIYGRDGKLAHGVIPSDIPRDTTTDRGFRFTPFLQSGDSTLLSYCSKLREWWNAVECKKMEFLGKTHQVGNNVLTPPPERSARPWLSIKDANTGTISNGYFNCVAKVSVPVQVLPIFLGLILVLSDRSFTNIAQINSTTRSTSPTILRMTNARLTTLLIGVLLGWQNRVSESNCGIGLLRWDRIWKLETSTVSEIYV